MKIVQILSHVDKQASGPTRSVWGLCEALAKRGNAVTLMTLAREIVSESDLFRLESFPSSRGPDSLGRSRKMFEALSRSEADILHSHSLWRMSNVYPAWVTKCDKKLFVASPRGTLSPVALRFSGLQKRIFWSVLQRNALRRASLLHATSDQEFQDIRNAGLTQPVAVIPNAVHIPDEKPSTSAKSGLRRLLYLGRLHPIKGLEMLLQVWARIAPRFSDWELRLVGPSDGDFITRLKKIEARLGLQRVTFAGDRYGAEKNSEYAAADLYILPSFSENFAISVAEALASSVPVITTTSTPWGGVKAHDCGWCVPAQEADIEAALIEALNNDVAKLRRMGANGRAWIAREFSWDRVGYEMEASYRWILTGGSKPFCVRTGDL